MVSTFTSPNEVCVMGFDGIRGVSPRPGMNAAFKRKKSRITGEVSWVFYLDECRCAFFDTPEDAQDFAAEMNQIAKDWPGTFRATSIQEVPGYETCSHFDVVVWD